MIPILKWHSLPVGPAIQLTQTQKRPLTYRTIPKDTKPTNNTTPIISTIWPLAFEIGIFGFVLSFDEPVKRHCFQGCVKFSHIWFYLQLVFPPTLWSHKWVEYRLQRDVVRRKAVPEFAMKCRRQLFTPQQYLYFLNCWLNQSMASVTEFFSIPEICLVCQFRGL